MQKGAETHPTGHQILLPLFGWQRQTQFADGLGCLGKVPPQGAMIEVLRGSRSEKNNASSKTGRRQVAAISFAASSWVSARPRYATPD